MMDKSLYFDFKENFEANKLIIMREKIEINYKKI